MRNDANSRGNCHNLNGKSKKRLSKKKSICVGLLSGAVVTGSIVALTSNGKSFAAIGVARANLFAPTSTIDKSTVVDCGAKNRPISSQIYGINEYLTDQSSGQFALAATARRFGGNTSSIYNYDQDYYNTAQDWFYENQVAPVRWKAILSENIAHSMKSVFTVPIGDFVSKDSVSHSFPVSVYGAQQSVDQYKLDAGNGIKPDGSRLLANIARSYQPQTPVDIARYAQNIVKAGGTNIDHIILDNEPMLWSQTHADMHPKPTTTDELVAKTLAASRSIRSAVPGVKLAGPALWGVVSYLNSEVDTRADKYGASAPDRAAHGGSPFLASYLRMLKSADVADNAKSIDTVDIHFYPQGENVYSNTNDAATAKLRISQTRGLWDKTYRDESWLSSTEIPEIAVLPRVQGWIDGNYRGLGLSIGEWSFGGENHISGALANAEALGQFGVFGVESAYYWYFPKAGSPGAMAFRAFRNYDGAGSNFGDVSIAAIGDAPNTAERLSVFASKDASGKPVTVLLNLSQKAIMKTSLAFQNCAPLGSYRSFSYDGSSTDAATNSKFSPAVTGLLVNDAASLTLAPYSITVLDFNSVQTLGTSTTKSPSIATGVPMTSSTPTIALVPITTVKPAATTSSVVVVNNQSAIGSSTKVPTMLALTDTTTIKPPTPLVTTTLLRAPTTVPIRVTATLSPVATTMAKPPTTLQIQVTRGPSAPITQPPAIVVPRVTAAPRPARASVTTVAVTITTLGGSTRAPRVVRQRS